MNKAGCARGISTRYRHPSTIWSTLLRAGPPLSAPRPSDLHRAGAGTSPSSGRTDRRLHGAVRDRRRGAAAGAADAYPPHERTGDRSPRAPRVAAALPNRDGGALGPPEGMVAPSPDRPGSERGRGAVGRPRPGIEGITLTAFPSSNASRRSGRPRLAVGDLLELLLAGHNSGLHYGRSGSPFTRRDTSLPHPPPGALRCRVADSPSLGRAAGRLAPGPILSARATCPPMRRPRALTVASAIVPSGARGATSASLLPAQGVALGPLRNTLTTGCRVIRTRPTAPAASLRQVCPTWRSPVTARSGPDLRGTDGRAVHELQPGHCLGGHPFGPPSSPPILFTPATECLGRPSNRVPRVMRRLHPGRASSSVINILMGRASGARCITATPAPARSCGGISHMAVSPSCPA